MALRSLTALVGVGLAFGFGVAGLPGRAYAKPRPVRIESTPSGATVYLDSKDGEALGRTPYAGKLAAGSHTLIVEMDGYVSQVQDITIKRQKKVQRFSVELSKIDLATIEVLPAKAQTEVKGARVLVDGKDTGNLPDTIKVPAGPHQVEVIKEGYKSFETWVEVAEGEKFVVTAELVPLDGTAGGKKGRGKGKRVSGDDDEGDEVDGGEPEDGERVALGSDGGDEEDVEGSAGDGEDPDASLDEEVVSDKRTVPYVAVAAGFELGGRRFRYQQATGFRPYDAGGVPMVRIALDLNPLAFARSKLVSGWGLYASYARATPLDSTATLMGGAKATVPTKWNELDLGLRFRYRVAGGSHIGLEGGYGTHTFTFDFTGQADDLRTQVPDVEYKFIRLGLEGRLGMGRFGILASGGTRLVSATGNLGLQFAKTDVIAFQGGLGLAATVTDSIEARLVGRYDHFSHSFTPIAGAMATAESGLDQFFGAMLSAIFHY